MRLLLLYNGYVIIIIIIIITCGLHNHTYIKPIARDVQLKIPASSHIATGYNSYFTITTVFELQYHFPVFK